MAVEEAVEDTGESKDKRRVASRHQNQTDLEGFILPDYTKRIHEFSVVIYKSGLIMLLILRIFA